MSFVVSLPILFIFKNFLITFVFAKGGGLICDALGRKQIKIQLHAKLSLWEETYKVAKSLSDQSWSYLKIYLFSQFSE